MSYVLYETVQDCCVLGFPFGSKHLCFSELTEREQVTIDEFLQWVFKHFEVLRVHVQVLG